MTEHEIGVVRHFFDKIGVVAMELTLDGLAVGETIHIKGHTTDITCPVTSMRIDRDSVEKADKGTPVGLKIDGKCREHDKVFKVTEP
jgi:putative protease